MHTVWGTITLTNDILWELHSKRTSQVRILQALAQLSPLPRGKLTNLQEGKRDTPTSKGRHKSKFSFGRSKEFGRLGGPTRPQSPKGEKLKELYFHPVTGQSSLLLGRHRGV